MKSLSKIPLLIAIMTLIFAEAYSQTDTLVIYNNKNGKEFNFALGNIQKATLVGLPTVTTLDVKKITSNSATSGGNVTDEGGDTVTARGVCWSKNTNPTINDSTTINGRGIDSFISNITNLIQNTTYYIKAYATNSIGTAYGNELSFTTSANLPTVTTNNLTDITSNSVTTGGNVTDEGGGKVTARGVCWSKNTNPTIENDTTIDSSGIGPFISNITNLTKNRTYYIRAYATNSYGTAYGEEKEFTTLSGSDLKVLLPNGSEIFEEGKNYDIKWSFSGTNSDKITIDFSTNNGVNWDNIVSGIPANTESYNWFVPNSPSSNCLIQITNLNDILVNDVSDNVFTIKEGTGSITYKFPDYVKVCSNPTLGAITVKNNLKTNPNKNYRLTFSGTFSIWNRTDNCGTEPNSCCGIDAGYLYSIPQIETNNWPSESILPLPAWVGDSKTYKTKNDIILRNQTGLRFNGEPLNFSIYQPSHIYYLENKQGTGDYFNFQILDSTKTNGTTSASYSDNCGCIDVRIEELPDNLPETKICDQICIIYGKTNEVKGIQLKTAFFENDQSRPTGKQNKLSNLDPKSLAIFINNIRYYADSIRCHDSIIGSEDIPINFGLLVDISQSMIDPINGDKMKIEAAKFALKNFINGMRQGDKACLMTFAEDTKTIKDWTDSKDTLINDINNLIPDEKAKTTHLFNAIDQGITKLNNIAGPKALIILGDGDDNSGINWDTYKLIEKVNNTNIQPIYFVLVNDGKMEIKNKDKLIELANQSGGKAFDIKSSTELNELYTKLGQDLVNEQCCTIFINNMTEKKGSIRMFYSLNDTVFSSRLTSFDCDLNYITNIEFLGVDDNEIKMNVVPNPLNATSEIRYETPEQGLVEITIHDMLGNKLNMISKGIQEIGKYTELIEGSNLQSGSYIATVTLNGRTVSRKIIVIH